MGKKSKRERDKWNMKYTDAKDRADKHERGFGPTSNFKVPKGMEIFKFRKPKKYRLDVIGYIVGKDNPMADEGSVHYERTMFVHKGLGSDGRGMEICNTKTFPKRNVACGGCKTLNKIRKKLDKETVGKLLPKENQGFLIIDRDEMEKGVQLFQSAYFMSFGEMLDEEMSDMSEKDKRRKFFKIEGGKTLEVRVKKASFNGNPYNKPTRINFIDREEDYTITDVDSDKKVITFECGEFTFIAPCIDDMLSPSDPKKLAKMMLDGPTDDDEEKEDEDEEDTDDDDDGDDSDLDDNEGDDEDDEEDGDDDDDSDKPKLKKKSPKDDVDDEDEDDEEDDDEDEDEEDDDKPKKKGKKLPTAKECGIKKGMKVKSMKKKKLGICTVSGISKDGTSIYLEDEDGEKITGVVHGPEELEIVGGEQDEDDEDDEKPVKKKRGRPKKKVEEDEDEEEESEEDNDDEDEDDDEEDDSDSDDDDDSDDEEDKPKKKVKGKKKSKKDDDDEDEDVDLPF